MKTYNEIKEWMKANGYSMEEASSGYYYCVHTDEDGNRKTVWMDPAFEDAYDLVNATCVAYSFINE